MSIERKKNEYHYRFNVRKTTYRGICVDCETYQEAKYYETKKKADVLRVQEAQRLEDIIKLKESSIIASNPIPIQSLFDIAMSKPMEREAGEQRIAMKRKFWDDFTFYMEYEHPDKPYAQLVSKSDAEYYISFIRENGSFKEHYRVKEWNKKPYSTFYANEILMTLKAIFKYSMEETGLKENPFGKIAKKKSMEQISREPFTMEELELIFSKANDFMYPLFYIGLFSGLRMGDMCMLKKSSIQQSNTLDKNGNPVWFLRLDIRKTGAYVSIPVCSCLFEYLQPLLQKHKNSEYLLPEHAKIYQHNKSIISQRVKKFLDELNITTNVHSDKRTYAVNKKGIHSLRHTFCTLAGINNIPLPVVQSIVGHMTPEMTKLYMRTIDERDKARCIDIFGSSVSCMIGNKEIRQIGCMNGENNKDREFIENILDNLSDDEIKELRIEFEERFAVRN